jgi:hypothetical protein
MKRWNFALFCCVLALGCNWTDGPCWYRGEGGGIGTGVGVGGSFGVAVGVGVGGSGDHGHGPMGAEERRDPPICNADDLPEEGEEAEELGELTCPPSRRGAECMILCAGYGVSCPAGHPHPHANIRPNAGMGLLWKCCNCKGQEQCKYVFDNGDACTFFKNDWKHPLCVYGGGK